MHIENRRKVGFALVGVSVLAGATIQLFTGGVVKAQTTREDKLQSGLVASQIDLDIDSHYAVPLVVCCALGLGCIVWPSRRPPRLAS